MTWDISGLSFDNLSFTPVESGTLDLHGMALKPDGTELYLLNEAGSWPFIDQHTLSTPFDISTAGTATTGTLLNPHANLVPGTLWFKPDGTKLFTMNNGGGGFDESQIWEVALGTAWDITTVSASETIFDVNTTIGTFGWAAHMSDNGEHLYVQEGTTGAKDGVTIHQWDLSTAWDISTAALAGKSFDPSAQVSSGTNLWIGNLGNTLIITVAAICYQYTMTTAYDISTAVYADKTYNLAGDVADIARMDIWIDPCSTKFYSTGKSGGIGDEVIYQWDMGPTSCVPSITGFFVGNGKEGGVIAGACSYSLNTVVGDKAELCTDSDGNPVTYISGGETREAVNIITGLVCLEGQEVSIFADGSVEDKQIVTNFKITIPDGRKVTQAAIGLPYTTDIETLDIKANANGTLRGDLKKITYVTIQFYKSKMPLIGPDKDNLTEIKIREDESYGEEINLLTGNKIVNIPPSWNTAGRILIRNTNPTPFTVLGLFPFIITDDGFDE